MSQDDVLEDLTVRKIADFEEIGSGLVLTSVSLDWDGNPVILFEEGRPPFPMNCDGAGTQAWYNNPPSAHHVVRFRDDNVERVTVVNESRAPLTQFAQPYNDGWILADSRNGRAVIYDFSGGAKGKIEIGDAVNHLQTTEDGSIWVSYFDEGVYGGGIGQNGLVCFDSMGEPTFKFAELATEQHLPYIDDCYALNVCRDCVWLSYYSKFPLICLRDLRVECHLNPGIAFGSFAVRQETILYTPAYGDGAVHSMNLASEKRRDFSPIDEQGRRLSNFKGRNYEFFASDPDTLRRYKPFQAVARGSSLYLYTEESLYEIPQEL